MTRTTPLPSSTAEWTRWAQAAGVEATSRRQPHRRADPASGRRHRPRHGPGLDERDEAMQRRARELAERPSSGMRFGFAGSACRPLIR